MFDVGSGLHGRSTHQLLLMLWSDWSAGVVRSARRCWRRLLSDRCLLRCLEVRCLCVFMVSEVDVCSSVCEYRRSSFDTVTWTCKSIHSQCASLPSLQACCDLATILASILANILVIYWEYARTHARMYLSNLLWYKLGIMLGYMLGCMLGCMLGFMLGC